MTQEVENSLVDKFVETGNVNYYMIKTSIERAEEGAKSLSSRTMIRKAIEEYLDGDRSLEELKIYTEDKYIDGAKALDNITYAQRIVEGESIAEHNISNVLIPENKFNGNNSLEEMTVEFKEDRSMVLIYSPIIIDKDVAGYDYMIYMIDDKLSLLCTEDIDVGLIDYNQYTDLLEGNKLLESGEESAVLETETDLYALHEMDDTIFYTKTSKSDLFGHFDRVINRIILGSIFLFIFIGVFIYVFIIRYAQNEIKALDKSREEFKTIAYFDQLTGAYTRRFLEVWNESYRKKDELYSIVMIDVDDFKNINDIFGHDTGDLALKRIAETIIGNLRETDVLIRFGGDEFLIILPSADIDETEYLMKRIEKKIQEMEDVSVDISFGISSFREEESFEEAIKEADNLMYKNKLEKKSSN